MLPTSTPTSVFAERSLLWPGGRGHLAWAALPSHHESREEG